MEDTHMNEADPPLYQNSNEISGESVLTVAAQFGVKHEEGMLIVDRSPERPSGQIVVKVGLACPLALSLPPPRVAKPAATAAKGPSMGRVRVMFRPTAASWP